MALAALPPALLAQPAGVSGRVSAADTPLAAAKVYAYALAREGMTGVETEVNGAFRFDDLPAGLYKIIAFKPGFLPAVALLTRASADAAQFVDMELEQASAEVAANADDYWAARRRIPGDVLRQIELAEAAAAWASSETPAADPMSLRATMQATTGVDSILDDAGQDVTGGRFDLEGAYGEVRIGVEGNYQALAPSSTGSRAEGRSSWLSFDVTDGGVHEVRVTSVDNQLVPRDDRADPIELQTHRVSWERSGRQSVARLAAQYTEEANYYSQDRFASLSIPDASRSWRLEGSYSADVATRARFDAGFRYRERDTDFDPLDDTLSDERVEVFGTGGLDVSPSVLVEYGMYSALRNGTVSLMPRGGVVLQLAPRWRASGMASVKAHESGGVDHTLGTELATVQYGDYLSCDHAAEYCYQVTVSRWAGERQTFSIGAVTRRFDETLRLHFDESFFNQYEHLYLVPGDTVPELQMTVSRRLGPGVSTRLSSSLGGGGGGTVLLGKKLRGYTNDVRYMVTSLDTHFDQTATGVFVAFHHLEQTLQSQRRAHRLRELVEVQRLQLMLTQELGILHQLASDFAVQLNMELSRGLVDGATGALDDPEEIRSRVTGGLAVTF